MKAFNLYTPYSREKPIKRCTVTLMIIGPLSEFAECCKTAGQSAAKL